MLLFLLRMCVTALWELRLWLRVRLVSLYTFSPPVTVSRRCIFYGTFLLFILHVYLRYVVSSVPCCLVITCLERADFLALLCIVVLCVLSLSHMVFRVRYGTWLYRFPIPVFLSNYIIYTMHNKFSNFLCFASFFVLIFVQCRSISIAMTRIGS